MQPCIVLTECKDGLLQASKTSLVLDCVDIVDDDSMDISLAFSCMMAAYFVYGIQYPRKLKNTLAFMQHFVFGISPPGDKILHLYIVTWCTWYSGLQICCVVRTTDVSLF